MPHRMSRLVSAARLAAAATALAATAAAAQAPVAPASAAAPAPAPAQPDTGITLFGEVRTRGEAERPGSGVRGDAFVLLRTRVGARARLGAATRLLVEVQDARVFGEERGTTDAAADAFDLHQGWLELGGRWSGADVALRAGRQEIVLGNERLVGAVGWSNTGRAFDGARLLLSRPGQPAGSWQATAFGATLEERGRRYGVAQPAPAQRADQMLVGVQATNGAVELLALHDRAARFRAFGEVDRTTAYARLRTPARLAVRADLEGAWQGGTQTRAATEASPAVAQDVRAWFAGARLSADARPGVATTFTLGADWLSGDADPADGRYGAFHTLYATNHKWYGTMDLFLDPAAATADRGLVDALASAAITLSPRATLRVDAHHFRLAAEHPTADGRALGEELDLTLPLRVSGSALELGYSLFRPGAAGAALGLGGEGRVRHWGYVQLRAAF
jgi:hypothetical protein